MGGTLVPKNEKLNCCFLPSWQGILERKNPKGSDHPCIGGESTVHGKEKGHHGKLFLQAVPCVTWKHRMWSCVSWGVCGTGETLFPRWTEYRLFGGWKPDWGPDCVSLWFVGVGWWGEECFARFSFDLCVVFFSFFSFLFSFVVVV
ncbi:hypothetical protein RLOC_00013581 [Lonchura striata]|uniref:Uncharacterized protein n=1 Tax=Lonchura striata TaxID=40157 RepID=A0A218VF50_9PASE|nr:hypothetical protein RLOC_00013581 [Lonchura striata domestica]